MKPEDFPWLCSASEKASNSAQFRHFLLLRAQLMVFFLVTLLTVCSGVLAPYFKKPLSVAVAIFLGAGIILTVLASALRFDKTWFDARAVAESVKTATWRYIIKGNPFGLDAPQPEELFIAELSEIQNSRPSVRGYLVADSRAKSISDRMRAIRASDFVNRKAEYLEGRIRDQKNWYGNKAIWNKKRAACWYATILVAQVFALVWAILAAAYGPFNFNLAGLLMTTAASFTAWSQAKRHEDLTNSYSVASQELLNIESLAEKVADEDTFRQIIDQAEDAISREHTMWCAKRNILPIMKKKGS
ncbi:MAG TPA: DUF4231 domain-containing protein [Candidatus Angelobacter sp.]|nr:DUF4231 domain-containing protein [Candidatus Angelobacter sp.]